MGHARVLNPVLHSEYATQDSKRRPKLQYHLIEPSRRPREVVVSVMVRDTIWIVSPFNSVFGHSNDHNYSIYFRN